MSRLKELEELAEQLNEGDEKCCSCEGKASPPHSCPYADEMSDDGESTSLCNCCEQCMHECAMHI